MAVKRIASFEMNHDVLRPGIYTSRIDGDVVTYDIRMTQPNSGHYLDNDEIHTFEHLFATYARNSKWSDAVVYFGPMGCRTGFYFLVRDSIPPEQAIALVNETLDFISGYEGEIPGTTTRECGNAAEHNLKKPKRWQNGCAVYWMAGPWISLFMKSDVIAWQINW